MSINCFIIAAMSADGYIAKDEKHSSFGWTSKADKKRFVELTKKAGIIVMGSTTFATFPGLLKERVNIVYSHSKTFEGAETTQKKPAELLAELESRGFKEAAICGGAHVYTMFMKAGVVDRLLLTIEPIVFGSGIRLFNDDMHYQLKLVGAAESAEGALLLEYKVDHAGSPKLTID